MTLLEFFAKDEADADLLEWFITRLEAVSWYAEREEWK